MILTVVVTFTHERWGRDAATAMLRGVVLSLIGFVAFFWVVSTFVVRFGLVETYVLAAVTGLSFSTLLLGVNGWRARRARLAQRPVQ